VLEYFLSNKNIDINNWGKRTPMSNAINENNYNIAKLFIKYGYKPNDKDYVSIQEQMVTLKKMILVRLIKKKH